MDSPALPDAATGGSQFYVYRNTLRRLTLKVALNYNILPAALILEGVKVTDGSQHGAGGFADVFRGTYVGAPVAVKKLRVYIMSTESQKRDMKKVSTNDFGSSVHVFTGLFLLGILSRVDPLEKPRS